MPKIRFKQSHKLIIVITLLLMGGIVYLHYSPKPPLSSYYTSSTAIYARRGELLRLTLAKDQQYRVWTDLEDIPKNIQQATLLYEDRWFYQHIGINPLALLRSVWMTYGKDARQGASTITMQVARQLYGINSRSVSGKLWQIVAAFCLELRYSKHDILESKPFSEVGF